MDSESKSDTRNVVDEFKHQSMEHIVDALDERRQPLHIAIENLERDFNMGTIVRTANAFNVEAIHIIGRRQWNKRGAMATDKYMHLYYHDSVADFVAAVEDREIIGVDNVGGSIDLATATLPRNAVLVFGSEANGLSKDMIDSCRQIVAIEQFGSTRSLNVGVAAGVAMYQWLSQNVL